MTDRYTKFVLTMIAVCLLYLCYALPSAVPVLQAATRASSETVDVNIVGVGGHRFESYQIRDVEPALPVKEVDPVR